MRTHISAFFIALLSIFTLCKEQIAYAKPKTHHTDPNVILYYIADGWKKLERSMSDCHTLVDPKTHAASILYLPYGFEAPAHLEKLKQQCGLTIKSLPNKINKLGDVDGNKIDPSGLLYLPHPYIVPGGMFNEMYGWDSYFIIRGLLEAKKVKLAYGIVENFFFEIEHYGGVLNGNRTYYLSRTQLPFLAPIIRVIYETDTNQQFVNEKWLERAYVYAVKDYNLWTHEPHLAGDTKLSRYYDFGDGPVYELSSKSYYEDVIRYFLQHPKLAQPYLLKPEEATQGPQGSFYDISLCSKSEKLDKKNYNVCKVVNVGLSNYFFKGDRAMRESGFDVSFRFGPFSADTLDYAPVDLNSLLYKAEKDLEWMSLKLGKHENAKKWAALANERRERINQYLWNEKAGLYFDYNFKTKQQSKYPYATTFYPLWAELASPKQAKQLASKLKLFEKHGGVVTSLRHTGVQWDYPYGWAPIQLITIEGFYQYGFKDIGHRLSHKFLNMVLKNYMHDKTIREKYDVVSGSATTNIKIGYKMNVIGFGWTNGVFLVLLHKLPVEIAKNLLGLSYSSKLYTDDSTKKIMSENETHS